jgi:MarC family membrane protein
MDSDLFSAAVVLLLVVDPFGNVPLVVATLHGVAPERHRRIVVRECLFAYAILLLFMLGGKAFLALLNLTETSLSIAGGIVLFLIALRMVFPRAEGIFGQPAGEEPMLVPLAIPAIAGPSALATVMLLASRDPSRLPTWIAALTIAMAITTVVLAFSDRMEGMLGPRAVIAVERLMGLVLTAVAVQMFLSGVKAFVLELST